MEAQKGWSHTILVKDSHLKICKKVRIVFCWEIFWAIFWYIWNSVSDFDNLSTVFWFIRQEPKGGWKSVAGGRNGSLGGSDWKWFNFNPAAPPIISHHVTWHGTIAQLPPLPPLYSGVERKRSSCDGVELCRVFARSCGYPNMCFCPDSKFSSCVLCI